MLHLAIVNGPNLNLTGLREPSIYGSSRFEDKVPVWQSLFQRQAVIHYYQSNVEGELINYLHQCRTTMHGIVINAGGYTHTSIALADAISAIAIPVVEVHLSNVLAREAYRKTSYISSRCVGSISGLGMIGYELALSYLCQTLGSEPS